MKTGQKKSGKSATNSPAPEPRQAGKWFKFRMTYGSRGGVYELLPARHADHDMFGQVDSILSAVFDQSKIAGDAATGTIEVHVESNFANKFIPMDLRAVVSQGLTAALKQLLSDGLPREWQLPAATPLELKFNLNYHSKYIKSSTKLMVDGNDLNEAPPPAPNEATHRPAYLTDLLARIPRQATFEEVVASLSETNHDVRMEFANRLEPALNKKLGDGSFPQATLDEKKTICDFIEKTLEPLGLALRCPKTSLPGKLRATTGNWPGVGRFHFEVYIDGKREKPAVADELPRLKLIDANGVPSPETLWEKKVGRKSGRKGPKLT